jgi:hypothetical protein
LEGEALLGLEIQAWMDAFAAAQEQWKSPDSTAAPSQPAIL